MISTTIRNRGKLGVGGFVFLAFFGLFWSGITLTFDGHIVWSAWRQLWALGYSTATGQITHSEVEEHGGGGDDGPSYLAKLKYKYRVADDEYLGDRYRYGQVSSGDRNAQRIVAEHPVGREVTVYYHPAHPADAVLKVGLEGCDFFMAMFMVPFNLVMLGIWIAAGGGVYRRIVAVPAGGAKIWDDGGRVHVRLAEMRSLYVGAAAAGAVAFVGVFIVGFGFGFNPSMPIMLLAWGAILGGGAWAYLYHRGKLARGDLDLVIDDIAQTVALPRPADCQTETVVPIRDITSVEIKQIEKRDSDGDVSYRYAPVLVVTDRAGSTRRETLVEWADQACAEELAAWLRERLRIEPPRGDFS